MLSRHCCGHSWMRIYCHIVAWGFGSKVSSSVQTVSQAEDIMRRLTFRSNTAFSVPLWKNAAVSSDAEWEPIVCVAPPVRTINRIQRLGSKAYR